MFSPHQALVRELETTAEENTQQRRAMDLNLLFPFRFQQSREPSKPFPCVLTPKEMAQTGQM